MNDFVHDDGQGNLYHNKEMAVTVVEMEMFCTSTWLHTIHISKCTVLHNPPVYYLPDPGTRILVPTSQYPHSSINNLQTHRTNYKEQQ